MTQSIHHAHSPQNPPRPGRKPRAREALAAWLAENEARANSMTIRAIASEVGISERSVRRVVGSRDFALRTGRNGWRTAHGEIPPLPDRVETSRVIDDRELHGLLRRWVALQRAATHSPIRKREADQLYADRLYGPIKSLVAVTGSKLPGRGLLSEDNRAACVAHITCQLIQKFDHTRIAPPRTGSLVTWAAYQYLTDCVTGGKAHRQDSITFAALDRTHTERIKDGHDIQDRIDARRLQLGASQVKSAKPDPKRPGWLVVKFVTFYRPFSAWDDDDDPHDPREKGRGEWDAYDDRVVCRGAIRPLVAELIMFVDSIELNNRWKQPQERIRRRWCAWRRERGRVARVDDDTWAEVVDALRQLAALTH